MVTMTKMSKVWSAFLGAAILIGFAGHSNADPKGKWLTDGGKSQVKIEACGDKLCGEIVWLKEPNNTDGSAKVDINNENEAMRSRPIIGLKLLTNFSGKGPGKWDGGKIYNPEDGKTYNSKLEEADSRTLQVSGCVFIFCKTQHWTSVE
jgi:uncharacterized protein (DUF2147 family)